MEQHPQRSYLRDDDAKARRTYARRSRVRFSRDQSIGIALIFFGIVGVAGAVQEAYGGRFAFLVVVLALGRSIPRADSHNPARMARRRLTPDAAGEVGKPSAGSRDGWPAGTRYSRRARLVPRSKPQRLGITSCGERDADNKLDRVFWHARS